MKRGLVLNLISNIMFFVSGYALHFFLGNTMPAASYGIVGTIITVLDFEYMFVSNGARQSLASQISRRKYDVRDVIAKTTLFQLLVIAVFFSIDFFGAPLFGLVLNDPSLDFYFKVAGFLVIVNGLQVILLGVNDGLQRFGISALLSTFYPIAKLGVIPLIIFVFRDDPVLGVEVGFLLAVALTIVLGCILLAANHAPLNERRPERIPFGDIAKHTLSFSFFFIMVSLVLSMDTLVVKAVVEPAAMAGYYTGAMNFGKITYYLLQAFSTIILPVVAKLIGEGKRGEAVERMQQFLLIAFMVILPISVIIAASSRSLLSSFYSQPFTVAAVALSCLTFSNFFMGITVMLNMVLNSFGSSRFSDALSIVSLVVTIPLFIVSAKYGGITHIAVASAACTGTAMLVSFARVRAKAGEPLTARAWKTLALNAALAVACGVLFHFVTIDNLLLLALAYVAIFAAYLVCLPLLRIVPLADLKHFGSSVYSSSR
ncbi:lipopolysaccharide biosynthesis protein [Bifidobacterium biavatii]|uniref:Polysaccharide biosynthesis protein n=1 Tax=Bifidobacterium biavatii DSM 23969 TaxID=1437608 RepID=A0A086ZN27_9BIFI|nr:MATE family efflux transporter [Bifidobacterium biavatii]KFI47927.1 polysaccharide biosynthesis protein [Bifidobacterium biavatii DSM 23969]